MDLIQIIYVCFLPEPKIEICPRRVTIDQIEEAEDYLEKIKEPALIIDSDFIVAVEDQRTFNRVTEVNILSRRIRNKFPEKMENVTIGFIIPELADNDRFVGWAGDQDFFVSTATNRPLENLIVHEYLHTEGYSHTCEIVPEFGTYKNEKEYQEQSLLLWMECLPYKLDIMHPFVCGDNPDLDACEFRGYRFE